MGYTRRYGQNNRTTNGNNYSRNNDNIQKKSSDKQQDLVCSIHSKNTEAQKAVAQAAQRQGITEGQVLRELFKDRDATSAWIDTFIDEIKSEEVNSYLNSLD